MNLSFFKVSNFRQTLSFLHSFFNIMLSKKSFSKITFSYIILIFLFVSSFVLLCLCPCHCTSLRSNSLLLTTTTRSITLLLLPLFLWHPLGYRQKLSHTILQNSRTIIVATIKEISSFLSSCVSTLSSHKLKPLASSGVQYISTSVDLYIASP